MVDVGEQVFVLEVRAQAALLSNGERRCTSSKVEFVVPTQHAVGLRHCVWDVVCALHSSFSGSRGRREPGDCREDLRSSLGHPTRTTSHPGSAAMPGSGGRGSLLLLLNR